MDKKKKKKDGSISFTNRLQSIRTKIIVLVFLSILITITISMAIVIPRAKSSLQNAVENNMLDLAESGNNLVDGIVSEYGAENITADILEQVLGDVKLQDMDTSYSYIVDTDGVFLYSPRTDKIGTTVLNDYVVNLLSEIANDNYDKTGIFHYTDENGLTKYASYCVSDNTHWVTVVLASESEVTATLTTVQRLSILVTLIVLLIAVIITAFITKSITAPILQLKDSMEQIGQLDFSQTEALEKYAHKKDETGLICKAAVQMQISLKEMVGRMETISSHLENNMNKLTNMSSVITESCNDNSATSEELAAIMQETSATAEQISQTLSRIKEHTFQISDHSEEGYHLSGEIKVRANDLHDSSIKSSEDAMEIYQNVKDETAKALEQSKAVEKINVLANTIHEIADQTSLLSLNASIEAARAGEFGKGFAVVSTDIGKLASESSETANEITEIIKEIHTAVTHMSDCLSTILDFLEKKVIDDYGKFVSVGEQYDQDAKDVQSSMDSIQKMSTELSSHSEQISTAVNDIAKTIEEAATGVSDIAGKTTDMVASTRDVSDVIYETNDFANELNEMVKSFKL